MEDLKELVLTKITDIAKLKEKKDIESGLKALGFNVKTKTRNKITRYYGADLNDNYIDLILKGSFYYLIYSLTSNKALIQSRDGLDSDYYAQLVENKGVRSNDRNVRFIYRDYLRIINHKRVYVSNQKRGIGRILLDDGTKPCEYETCDNEVDISDLKYLSNRYKIKSRSHYSFLIDIYNLREMIYEKIIPKPRLSEINNYRKQLLIKRLTNKTINYIVYKMFVNATIFASPVIFCSSYSVYGRADVLNHWLLEMKSWTELGSHAEMSKICDISFLDSVKFMSSIVFPKVIEYFEKIILDAKESTPKIEKSTVFLSKNEFSENSYISMSDLLNDKKSRLYKQITSDYEFSEKKVKVKEINNVIKLLEGPHEKLVNSEEL